MNVAVIKIGSRIAWGARDTSGGNAETRYIIDMLYKGGAQIDIYTKTLSKDTNPDYYNFYQIADTYKEINSKDYDALVVLNGNLQFYGGAEAKEQILNYNIINNFNKQIFYIFCDPALTLKQSWNSINAKDWGNKYEKEDIYIKRNDIIYISQPYNIEAVKEIIAKTKVQVSDIIHYPLEKFNCMDPKLPMKENPDVDLIYGGTMRGNRRIKKMVKFYFGYNDIKVEMFGKIKPNELDKVAKKFNDPVPPQFGDPVNYSDYSNKITNTFAHVVIGDEWYEGNDMPQRCYQSIWASTVTFIDIELDPQKRVFEKSDFCKSFNYVKDRYEVEEKIKAIKKNPEIRKKIIEAQFDAVDFDEYEFCKNFVNIIRENKNNYKNPNIINYDKYLVKKKTHVTKKIKSNTKNKTNMSKRNILIKSSDDIFNDMF